MSSSAAFQYSSDELDAMAGATHYYRWIIEGFRPYLSGTVIELGAGIGTVSSYLIAEDIERLILVEPAGELCERLHARFRTEPRIAITHGILDALEPELRADALVGVNVLEHIADDRQALRAAYQRLKPEGFLLLFVPAIPLLYGTMDQTFGHFRRYTKSRLGGLLVDAGFAVDRLHYANFLGVLAWFVAGKVLRRRTLTPRMVACSDRTLVRVTILMERRLHLPLGQSLFAIARKASRPLHPFASM